MTLPADAADSHWMRRCEALAAEARSEGNTAVGSVLVLDGKPLAEAAEQTPRGPRPFAHAEFLVVERALQLTPRPDLHAATLYSTAEPCILCGFAVREAGIGRVVVAHPAGDIGSIRSRLPVLTADWVARWGAPPVVVWMDVAVTPPRDAP